MALVTLFDLPNEILQQILLHVPPAAATKVQQVCHRFNALVEPLVWKHYCQTRYKYWSPEYHIRKRYASDVSSTDWKKIFARRYEIDRITTQTLNSILRSQTGRIDKFQRIIEYGYDAKDCLLRHIRCMDDAEDVLARRYYSDAVLGCLHRSLAIKEWSDLARGKEVSLERALAAFDMFVLHDRVGDLEEVSYRLDEIASDVRGSCPDLEEQKPRQRALTLAAYLRAYNFTGLKDLREYHALQNNFIGRALYDQEHPSLPLISTAIFCSIAKRIGLDAYPCGFPFHVYAIVRLPIGLDMDGNPCSPDSGDAKIMFMDPFRSSEEVPIGFLQTQFNSLGASADIEALVMGPASTSEIVLRSTRNIVTSVQDLPRNTGNRNIINALAERPDPEGAFYSALWASLLLGISPGGHGPVVTMVQRRAYLPHLVEHFEIYFPTDVSLIEQYIVPLFENSGEHAQLRDAVRVMRAGDAMPKQVKLRTKEISQQVRYQVGQVFKHKRYDYVAVITGWDIECNAGAQWELQMRVHELPRGRQQSFYNALVEDKEVRYVAEENIEIIKPEWPHQLIALAGKHFKRWDNTERKFISNIRDEYPDD